jgi:two-component system nitrogen regulation response regulator GlnG
MTLPTQARLLRLLQSGQIERSGGSESLASDVRIMAGTTQDLDALMSSGRFRADLYYRLRDVTLRLPPLRERREDIPELAHYFLFRMNRELGTLVQSISEEALELLARYHWPGNVRELQSAIRQALSGSSGLTLLAEHLPEKLQDSDNRPTISRGGDVPSSVDVDWLALRAIVDGALAGKRTGLYRAALEHFDRMLITRVLQKTGGNQVESANILGLSRPTLRAKMRSLKLLVQKTLGIAPAANDQKT